VLAAQQLQAELASPPQEPVPDQVLALALARQEVRLRKDWAAADALRRRIDELGWQVIDTPDGPQLKPGDKS
jgi:cysteinyl-tRNA synthetase